MSTLFRTHPWHATPARLALALALAAGGCAAPAATPSQAAWREAPAAGVARAETAAGRKRRYLEISHRQMRKLSQAIRLDEERLGPAALVAAALAAAGQPTREDAVRWVAAALDRCGGRRDCGMSYLALQRIALQYRESLSRDLLGRLVQEASRTTQAPPGQAVREPWSFKETENQRIVRMARNLVAFRLDPPAPGTPRAAAEQAWTAATEAFLLAHDREGWYEAESPGYIAASMTALLHLTDHAGSPRIRELAGRQLDLLFAEWAQEQVNGFPAGPKSRTYVQWALGAKNTPWLAWAWLAGGLNDSEKGGPQGVSFMDWPEIATSSYEIPAAVKRLLAERDRQPPYEIRARRSIALDKRRDLDTALYSFATPDYILGAAQSVRGLQLGVSGGQEIMATLYASCAPFAPLYLWSRTENPRANRWKSWTGNDQAMAHRNVALARLGAGEKGTWGHAYLAPAWAAPEILAPGGEPGEVVVTRCGDTYAALVTAGGWDVKPAPERFPAYYGGDKSFRGSWAAVPRRQPAAIALEVGRRAEDGTFEEWKRRVASARLTLAELTLDKSELRFTASGGTRLAFVPGESATVGGRPLAVDYPLLAGPFLASEGPGRWTFSFGGVRQRFETLNSVPAP